MLNWLRRRQTARILVLNATFLGAAPGLVRGQTATVTATQAFRKLSTEGQYREAEALSRRMLAQAEAARSPDDTRFWVGALAASLNALHRYAEAEPYCRRHLTLSRTLRGADSGDAVAALMGLSDAVWGQGRDAEAEPLLKELLSQCTRLYGADADPTTFQLQRLGGLYKRRGQFVEAAAAYRDALARSERRHGPVHDLPILALKELADCRVESGEFDEAERALRQAVERSERFAAADPEKRIARVCLADTSTDLARLLMKEGRHAEAAPLCEQAVARAERMFGPDDQGLLAPLLNLGVNLTDRGRFADAESVLERAAVLGMKTVGTRSPKTLMAVANLASVYSAQGRFDEAAELQAAALRGAEQFFEPGNFRLVTFLMNLAAARCEQGRYDAAEPLYRRALAVAEGSVGLEAPGTVKLLGALAKTEERLGHDAEARELFGKALAVSERVFGRDHPTTAYALIGLALFDLDRGRDGPAEALVDRALAIHEKAGVSPKERYLDYGIRAELRWRTGRRDQAIDDLRVALDLAEQQRGDLAATDRTRAQGFAHFATGFERMVAWQAERGQVGEAFAAAERFHARSLLDEMQLAGADLEAGRAAAEREALARRGAELKARVAALETKLDRTPEDAGLLREAARARQDLQAHETKVRTSSPTYRELLTRRSAPPRLDEVQRTLLGKGDLLLVYMTGAARSFVFAVRPDDAAVTELKIAPGAGRVLGVPPGALSAESLRAALSNEQGTGAVQRLAGPKAEGAADRLAALWTTLIPEALRTSLTDGTVKRLLVVPDGALALLPLETLVVEPGGGANGPRYLLDAGPPVLYGPSAAVLMNLAERAPRSPADGREPVLALGDPAYPPAAAAPAPAADRGGVPVARSRYGMAGGALARLPYSGWEAQWVAKAFNDRGIKAAVFNGGAATERAVRHWASGRKVLHLACHGLADEQFGTLFAALALAPGPRGDSDPSDDGYLTLPEIYGLDLKGCELAVLSACQTNLGPRQQGEGTWAVSRGFLVAGARRVLASDWVVDDEAAASLVSVYCTLLAQAESEGKPVDHAGFLREAKRWVRGHDKWKSPYFWGSLVLVGAP